MEFFCFAFLIKYASITGATKAMNGGYRQRQSKLDKKYNELLFLAIAMRLVKKKNKANIIGIKNQIPGKLPPFVIYGMTKSEIAEMTLLTPREFNNMKNVNTTSIPMIKVSGT